MEIKKEASKWQNVKAKITVLEDGEAKVKTITGSVRFMDGGSNIEATVKKIGEDSILPNIRIPIVETGKQLLIEQARADIVNFAYDELMRIFSEAGNISSAGAAFNVLATSIAQTKRLPSVWAQRDIQVAALSEDLWRELRDTTTALSAVRGTYIDSLRQKATKVLTDARPAFFRKAPPDR